jgi:hypothetical protein
MLEFISALLVVFLPGAIIIYDLVAGYFGGEAATLSRAVANLAERWPELPAIAGGLFTWLWLHLFLSGILSRGKL